MWMLVGVVLWAGAAASDNLLSNPGFESLTADKPNHWDVFVAPQEGAVGRVDTRAWAGEYSVMLHTPLPYPEDPVNNWSQNVFGQFSGKKMAVSGFIRTENATEAALWLQCWRKDPWGVLSTASNSADSPVYGTKDWTRVEFQITVPENTDFLTLRCVLKGTGSAWFDDLSITDVSASETPDPAKTPEKTPDQKPVAPAAAPAAPTAAPAAGASPVIQSAIPHMESMEQEVTRLQQANRTLAGAMDRMQEANDQLREELLMLREQLQMIQGRLKNENTVETQPGSITDKPAPAADNSPPLVPHGQNWSAAR